ncbi:MAG: hypothetical protein ACRDPY_34740 [Streptosporangiaceae bacterium]
MPTAQEVKPQARVLAAGGGIRCVTLGYDAMRGAGGGTLRFVLAAGRLCHLITGAGCAPADPGGPGVTGPVSWPVRGRCPAGCRPAWFAGSARGWSGRGRRSG